MKIIEGRINSSATRQIRNSSTYSYSQNTRLSNITINNTKAMLQNHTLELKKGDLVAAAGFFLFGRFMVMALVNKTRGSSWANNPWLQMALGVFIMFIPFFTDNPLTFTRSIWLFFVLPFVFISGLFLYFGIAILKTSRTLNAMLASPSQASKQKAASEDEEVLERVFYRIIWAATAVLALWLMLAVTGPKLYKMTQIRGFTAGGTVLERTITDKASQDWRSAFNTNRYASRRGTNYFIAWNEQPALEAGPNRINIQREQWENLNIGDSIDLVRIPNDEATYIRSGIYASNSNFIFDAMLLLLQLAIITNSAVRLLKRPQLKLENQT